MASELIGSYNMSFQCRVPAACIIFCVIFIICVAYQANVTLITVLIKIMSNGAAVAQAV
jgi:hypothetical protein